MAKFDLIVNDDIALPLLNQVKESMKDAEACALAFKNAADSCADSQDVSPYAKVCAGICNDIAVALSKMCELYKNLEDKTSKQAAIANEQDELAAEAERLARGGF